MAVPISALHGDNVAHRSKNTPWYDGPTIVDVLDAFKRPSRTQHAPLRFPIQDVYRFDDRRIVVGRVESGTVRVGDRLLFLPGGKQSTVKTIERWNVAEDGPGVAGDSIGLTLTEQVFLARGEVASRLDDAPIHTNEFKARLFWLGRRPLVMVGSTRSSWPLRSGKASSCVWRMLSTRRRWSRVAADDAMSADCVGDVTMRSQASIVVDLFRLVPPLGRFVVVDELDVCGGGVVISVGSDAVIATPASANIVRSVGQVSREERHARQGYRGAVVWFTGLSGAGKTTLAYALERELFTHRPSVVRFGRR